MPKYCYQCKECEHQFEVRHSIRDRLYDCIECEIPETLVRIPQLTQKRIDKRLPKIGDKVKEFIESNKEGLKEQIKEATEFYKP